MSKNSSKGIAALLLGAAIGAGIGLLFAPEKGKTTRGKIAGSLRARRDTLLNQIAVLSGQLGESFSVSGILGPDMAADAEQVSHEMVDKLEEKLAELKDAARKLRD
ncbi:MAG TPA: YtxH domain-containing protein [Flavobacterium sp.]|jgi:gas vesicle protein